MYPIISIQSGVVNVWCHGRKPVTQIQIPMGCETRRYVTDTPSLWMHCIHNQADSIGDRSPKYFREIWGVETPWFYGATLNGFGCTLFTV